MWASAWNKVVREGLGNQGEPRRAMWASRGELGVNWDGVVHEGLGVVVREGKVNQGELRRAMWAGSGKLGGDMGGVVHEGSRIV